jgi:hypothetical protein
VLLTVGADGTVSRERHHVATSQVADVAVDLTGTSHAGEVRERVSRHLAGLTGTVRVTLEGEVSPEMDLTTDDLGEPPPGLLMVARLGRITVGYDFEELAQERTVRGQFVRDVREAPHLTEEQRRKVLVTGLRALDGRADLEVQGC